MRKQVRSHSEEGAQNKVVNLDRWRRTGQSGVDIPRSPGSELSRGSLPARGLNWRQAVAGLSREEKQAVLLMFILSSGATDDQLSALLEAIMVMA